MHLLFHNMLLVRAEGIKLCLIHVIISPTGHQLHQEVLISDSPLRAIFLPCHTAGGPVRDLASNVGS